MRGPKLLMLVTAGLVTLAASAESAADRKTVIRNVHLVTMEDGEVVSGQELVIENDTIVALRPEGSIPDDAIVIDGEGGYLLPGLFDMHVHFRDDPAINRQFLDLYLAHGVTGVRSMHGDETIVELRNAVAAATLEGPEIWTTGPTTATARVSSPQEARAFVDAQKKAGYDAIKMYGNGSGSMNEETYAALIEAAAEADMPVIGHAPRGLSFEAVLRHDQRSVDHMEEIVYTWAPVSGLFRPWLDLQFGRVKLEDHPELSEPPAIEGLEKHMKDLARRMADAGIAVTPTLIAFRTIRDQADEEIDDLVELPSLAYIDPFLKVEWLPSFNRYRNGGWSAILGPIHRFLSTSVDVQQRLVGAFADAGVEILAGTDAPLPFVVPGVSLHDELELLVASGLSPVEAIRAATTTPARVLGVAERTGSIAPGKEADLVLLRSNPLESVDAVRTVAGVMANGRWYSRDDLDARLDSIRAAHERRERVIMSFLEGMTGGDVETAMVAYLSSSSRTEASDRTIERLINRYGYRALYRGELEAAVEIFSANATAFPDQFNTWDSLAEAHMNLGHDEEAIRYYRKSLELNPDNSNATKMIEQIKSQQVEEGAPSAVEDLDLSPPESLALTTNDWFDFHPVWSPRGDLIIWESSGEEAPRIMLVSSSGGEPRTIGMGEHPRWMPDGASVLYESDRAGEGTDLFMSDLEGSERRLTSESGNEGGAVPSPDGRRVAFLAEREDLWRLRVIDLATGRVTDAPDTQSSQFAPSWAPHGDRIAFMTRPEGNWDIYEWDGSGDEVNPLAATSAVESSPQWISDEDLALIHAAEGTSSLRTIRRSGGGITIRETDHQIDWYVVSRDRTKIAYTVGDGDANRVEVVPAQGGPSRLVVAADGRNVSPDWSPDGASIVFATNRDGDFDIHVVAVDERKE